MAITQRNLYLPGRDLTNLAGNVDLNRIGMDMTDISIVFGTPSVVTVSQGSMIECNGNIYTLEGSDETFNMTAGHNYLTFTDNPAPAFGSAAAQGTYDAAKGGYYQADGVTRTLKWYVDQTYEEYSGDLYLCEPYGNQKVYGYLDDGTPLFAKIISVTVENMETLGSAAHGITNAKTDKRIVSATVHRASGNPTFSYDDGSAGDEVIQKLYFDDVNVSVIEINMLGDIPFTVFVVYK